MQLQTLGELVGAGRDAAARRGARRDARASVARARQGGLAARPPDRVSHTPTGKTTAELEGRGRMPRWNGMWRPIGRDGSGGPLRYRPGSMERCLLASDPKRHVHIELRQRTAGEVPAHTGRDVPQRGNALRRRGARRKRSVDRDQMGATRFRVGVLQPCHRCTSKLARDHANAARSVVKLRSGAKRSSGWGRADI